MEPIGYLSRKLPLTTEQAMADLNTPVSKNIVSRLLWNEGFRRRKPQKKRKMGENADRNAQLEKIALLKKEYLEAGIPVISMDTKKKELLSNFYREGVTDAAEPTIDNDHDFTSSGSGTVIPHRIYDVAKNQASVHPNCSKDTSELARESIESSLMSPGPAKACRWKTSQGPNTTSRKRGQRKDSTSSSTSWKRFINRPQIRQGF